LLFRQNIDASSLPGATMAFTDRELLRLVEVGDQDAIVVIFDRYSPIVYTIALSILRSPESAEDVLQDLFMQLWHHPDRGQADCGSLYGWIMISSRDRAISLERKDDLTH
jgi:RNA polymerase sigma-70 factor, ECF subfamily